MDIFNEIVQNLFKALNHNETKFILIGGYAVNLHGYQRFTGDLDILIEDNLETRKKLRKAFIDMKMGDLPQLLTIQFVPGWTDFLLDNGLRLDILSPLKGLEDYSFNQIYQESSTFELEGITVKFLHIRHLIEAKRAVSRPKDLIDITQLEKIEKLRKTE